MSQKPQVRLEFLITVALIVILALIRFVSLDRFPLTDSEAEHALSASANTPLRSDFWPINGDERIGSPLYHVVTRLIFQTFGANEFTARVVPASAGLIMLLYLGLSDRKQSPPGLRLTWLFLLGFSPVMVTSARSAGGDIIAAAAFFPLFYGFMQEQKDSTPTSTLVMALAFAVALSTGRPVFVALTGITLSLLIASIVQRNRFSEWIQSMAWHDLKKATWIIPVVLLILMTGLGSSVESLRGFADGLEDWLMGWTQASGYSFIELVVLLVTSEPLIVLFGFLGFIQLWRNRAGMGWLATLWVIGAGIILLIYPGRSPFDLIWVVLPLSYLASRAILTLLERIGDPRSNPELVGLLVLLLTFVASGALSLMAYGAGNVLTINPDNPNLVLFLFLALAVMGLSVLVFFGLGWSWRVVIHAIGSLMLILGISQGISAIWDHNFADPVQDSADLWWQTVPSEGLPLLLLSLERTAIAYAGMEETLPLEVQGDLSPSLAWTLRTFEKTSGVPAFGTEAAPVILAVEGDDSVSLPADYVGQSLGIAEKRGWESALPPDIFRWLIKRDAPVLIDRWVMWVRADIASFGEIGLENGADTQNE